MTVDTYRPMRPNLLVYLCGPITARAGWTVEEHVAMALRVHHEALVLGIPTHCPHLNAAFPSAWTEIPRETWLSYGLAMVKRSTHLMTLPGWEASEGCQLEVEMAKDRRIPIIRFLSEIK